MDKLSAMALIHLAEINQQISYSCVDAHRN